MSDCTHPQTHELRNLGGFGEYCISCNALIKQTYTTSYTELQTAQAHIEGLEALLDEAIRELADCNTPITATRLQYFKKKAKALGEKK